MAAEPVVIPTPADVWVLIAEGVERATIYQRSFLPNVYTQTTRPAGEPAPTDGTDAVQIFECCHFTCVSSGEPIDVYIKSFRVDGEVRVDL